MKTIIDEIREELFSRAEPKYAAFNASLIPNIDPCKIIGVRIPTVRAMAKRYRKDARIGDFLSALPHEYLEEYHLHSFIICAERDFSACIGKVEELLPHVDNWAVCDSLRPASFARHKAELLPHINRWLASYLPYTRRFGIEMLMVHFLEEDFSEEMLYEVARVRTDDYYVRMMVAWYFATALTKQYDAALGLIEDGVLEPWCHNKAIQKACESRRISDERKEQLKKLKKAL